MQLQKALGMARQVHGKPLEAFQPDGAFKPADRSVRAEARAGVELKGTTPEPRA